MSNVKRALSPRHAALLAKFEAAGKGGLDDDSAAALVLKDLGYLEPYCPTTLRITVAGVRTIAHSLPPEKSIRQKSRGWHD